MGSVAVYAEAGVVRVNIRLKTGIIIRKGNRYLVGCYTVTGEMRWSLSPWDAWRTRRRDHAFIVADRVGGVRYLFNPVAGQLREMRT